MFFFFSVWLLRGIDLWWVSVESLLTMACDFGRMMGVERCRNRVDSPKTRVLGFDMEFVASSLSEWY